MANGLLMQWKRVFKGKDDFKKLSSINYLHYIKCPVLLQHGRLDESVPYEWSVELEKKFIENNIDYKFITYDKEDDVDTCELLDDIVSDSCIMRHNRNHRRGGR